MGCNENFVSHGCPFDEPGCFNPDMSIGKPFNRSELVVKQNRCCGMCDGVNDVCVSDTVCDEHKSLGCEICFGERGEYDPLLSPQWFSHRIGDTYTMDGKPELWKIAYYPVLSDNKTKEVYSEPRVLIERPIANGIDFREVPFRYLTKVKICYKSNEPCAFDCKGLCRESF